MAKNGHLYKLPLINFKLCHTDVDSANVVPSQLNAFNASGVLKDAAKRTAENGTYAPE